MASIIKANELQDFGGNSIITSDGAGNVTLSSGMNTAVAAGTNNTPAFHVNSPDNGVISSDTEVALSFTTELFDTNSAYDTSTHKFTPQVAGKYFIYGAVRFNSTNTFSRINLSIFKNTSDVLSARNDNIEYNTTNISGAVELNGSTDYVQLKAYQNSGISLAVTNSASLCFFGGYKIIGA